MRKLRNAILGAVVVLPFSVMVVSADETVKEVNNVDGVVRSAVLNVRDTYSIEGNKIGTVERGDNLDIIGEYTGWYRVVTDKGMQGWVSNAYVDILDGKTPVNYVVDESALTLDRVYDIQKNYAKNMVNAKLSKGEVNRGSGYIKATDEDIRYYTNPENFMNEEGINQFLRLDKYTSGVTADELNSILNNLPGGSKNVFYNSGEHFIESAKKYNLDVSYLVAHALWETGRGTSTLAKGQMVNGVKVYNFWGIGAFDGTANLSGKEAAYHNGWTSVASTIDGSARWLSEHYIHNEKYGQNTLYKMKFNNKVSWHQYATDINWANGIAGLMKDIIAMYDSGNGMGYEIPKYK